MMVCERCGGSTLLIDAYVALNDPDDVRTFDAVICDDCGTDTTPVTPEEFEASKSK